jgi:hypothetical protein
LLVASRRRLQEALAAVWDPAWADRLCRAASERLQRQYRTLPEVQRARLDHFALDPYESRMVGAGEDNDPLAFQATLKNWERVSLEALRRIRGDAGEVSRGKGAA